MRCAPNAGFTAVAGGEYHSLGLMIDSSIVAWGDNSDEQCGVPAPNAGFTALASGWRHSLGLKADGSVVAPNAKFAAVAAVVRACRSFPTARRIARSLGLRAGGSIVAWGRNDCGQCDVPAPNADFAAVAVGNYHSLGLKGDGSIVAWGYNAQDQCDVSLPNTDFVAGAVGEYHSLGLKSDGSIVAWGWNDFGQCDVPSAAFRRPCQPTSAKAKRDDILRQIFGG